MRYFNYNDRTGFYVFRRKQRLDRNWDTRTEGDDNNQKLRPSSDIEKQEKPITQTHTYLMQTSMYTHIHTDIYI